ncbi:MAG: SsrA-binding protein SmpB [Anaerohalosphaeraceae bacterium]|nr:SsrA-binding protein SmpB [Anaerohalosphaeraceae bacterium]
MAKDSDKKQAQVPRMVNKKAFFDYEIVEKVEAGLVLKGSEVKSLRLGGADLAGSFARILDKECWLIGCSIAPYAQATIVKHEPLRKRKLLLHKTQIKKITTKLQQRGFTLVPLRVFFNDRGLAKIELGIARGKRKYDKRAKLETHQQKADVARDTRKYK